MHTTASDLQLLTEAKDRIANARRNPNWGLQREAAWPAEVSQWVEAIADADGVAYYFNLKQLEHLWEHFSYTFLQRRAEVFLTERAERSEDLGLYLHGSGLGIRAPLYRRFQTLIPWKDAAKVSGTRDVKAIEAAEQEYVQHNFPDVYTRAAAAAGALLCCREFLRERNRLRELWRQLPVSVRPQLPLTRHLSFVMGDPHADGQSVLTAFMADLKPFLEFWQLRGFVTWDLPDPLDFHLVAKAEGDGNSTDPMESARLSPLVPLRLGDDRFSKNLLQRQEDWRTKRKLKLSSRRFELMANLSQINFLECAIAGRLRATNTPALSKTDHHGLLADILDMDEGHVRRCLRERPTE